VTNAAKPKYRTGVSRSGNYPPGSKAEYRQKKAFVAFEQNARVKWGGSGSSIIMQLLAAYLFLLGVDFCKRGL